MFHLWLRAESKPFEIAEPGGCAAISAEEVYDFNLAEM